MVCALLVGMRAICIFMLAFESIEPLYSKLGKPLTRHVTKSMRRWLHLLTCDQSDSIPLVCASIIYSHSTTDRTSALEGYY